MKLERGIIFNHFVSTNEYGKITRDIYCVIERSRCLVCYFSMIMMKKHNQRSKRVKMHSKTKLALKIEMHFNDDASIFNIHTIYSLLK